MAGLPLGWEWDYDGQRWFYKYKPTGHIQYHFPSEGDEFPDFIEAGTPAPDLAPEERLESQQQVKRQISLAGADNGGVNKYAMSATARPVSAVWEGDDDAEADGVFQPENFMFLGPGTYVDVSPLVEEEEEAAKRSVVGAVGERVGGGRSTETTAAAMAKGVSPPGSSKTTPTMAKSNPSASPGPVDARKKEEGRAIESVPVTNTAHIVESRPVPSQPPVQIESTAAVTGASGSSEIHMIDSREMPVEMMGDTMHRFDPVGFVAEMPTEQTAAAHIELHPDPVEIADNTVLAPIETAAAALLESAIAELPAKNSPVEGKGFPIVTSPEGPEGKQSTDGDKMMREDDIHPTKQAPQDHVQSYCQGATKSAESTPPLAQNTDPSCANQDSRQGFGQYGPHLVQHGQAQLSRPVKLETFKIARKQPGSTSGTPVAQQTQSPSYQAYVPGQTTTTSHLSNSEKRHSIGLRREVSLMMNMTRSSIGVDPNAVPRVLSPPQHAVPSAISKSAMPAQPRSTEFTKPRTDNTDLSLAHAPSVLKPARNRNSVQDIPPRQQVSTPAAVIAPPAQPQREPQRSEGIFKFPSVLRPARGRSSSQPGQGANGPVHQLDEPRTAQQTNQQPLAQQPLWATAHVVQTARPASAMPIMNHVPYGSQYAGAGFGPIPQRHQLAQPSSSGSSPLQQMHKAATSPPPRPQTVVGTIQALPKDTTKATTLLRPQQPAFESFIQPHLQIQNVVTEQLGRSRSVPAVVQPQLNVPILQQESVTTQCQVQLTQQVRHVEAGQPQPQPQPQPHSHQQHRPSSSHFQLTPTQLVQNPAGEKSNVPQNVQPAVNAGAVIETQSLTTQPKLQKTISSSLYQVQPLQQIQNAAAGQERHFSHGQSPSISDSASIPTVETNKTLESPGQVPAAMQADPTGQLSPAQMVRGQFSQGQIRPGQVLQGDASDQVPPQMRPMPTPLGQSSADQQLHNQILPGPVPSGRGYFGEAHPLQMPVSTPAEGSTPSQPYVQHQGRVGTTTQKTSNPNQAQMGHLKECSTQHSTEHTMIPAPLLKQPAVNNKWAQRPVADYSGGDWGDEENWEWR